MTTQLTSGLELERCAQDLRDAVAAGRFQEAGSLVLEYRRLFETVWNAQPESEAQSGELLAQAMSLMCWARTVAKSARAHMSRQAEQLTAVHEYGRPAPSRQTWHVFA